MFLASPLLYHITLMKWHGFFVPKHVFYQVLYKLIEFRVFEKKSFVPYRIVPYDFIRYHLVPYLNVRYRIVPSYPNNYGLDSWKARPIDTEYRQ